MAAHLGGMDTPLTSTEPDGIDVALPTSACTNFERQEDEVCAGDVWQRTSRSGLTTSFKCDACQYRLDERLNEIDQNYPDSPNPPSWFDETAIGEHWDSDY